MARRCPEPASGRRGAGQALLVADELISTIGLPNIVRIDATARRAGAGRAAGVQAQCERPHQAETDSRGAQAPWLILHLPTPSDGEPAAHYMCKYAESVTGVSCAVSPQILAVPMAHNRVRREAFKDGQIPMPGDSGKALGRGNPEALAQALQFRQSACMIAGRAARQ